MGKLGWRKIGGVFYPPEEVERVLALQAAQAEEEASPRASTPPRRRLPRDREQPEEGRLATAS